MKFFAGFILLGTLFLGSSLLQATEAVQLHRFNSVTAWNVNSFWIETEKSIFLIDAQLLSTDAELLANNIKSRHKLFKGVFITHPHPDHFAGLARLRDVLGDFPIYSSQATADQMELAFNNFLNNGYAKAFGDQVEQRFVKADHIMKNKQSLSIDGLHLQMDDLGAGESINNSVLYVAQQSWLFSGDATMHHQHYYLGEGRSTNVLTQLDYLQKQYSEAIFYSGHGEPSGAAIIAQQKQYIALLRKLVSEAIIDANNLDEETKHLKKAKRQQLSFQVVAQFPYLGTYGYEPHQVASMNLYGVESELLAEKKLRPMATL